MFALTNTLFFDNKKSVTAKKAESNLNYTSQGGANSVAALAEKGNPLLQYRLAQSYAKQMNDGKAIYWAKKAAEGGHVEAQALLAFLYLYAEEADNKSEALTWLAAAADNGNEKAQIQLGVMYLFGIEFAKDHGSAYYWLERAASVDNAMAKLFLAVMHKNGNGVNQDSAVSKALFREVFV